MNDETEMSREQLSSLLRFYAESGLDFPVGDATVDRFAEAPASTDAARPIVNSRTNSIGANDPHAPEDIEMDPRKRLAEIPRPIAASVTTSATTLPTVNILAQAVTMADAAMDFDALKTAVEQFDGCNLKRSARSTIFESGKRGAEVMVIGGAPSRDDDASGIAFSGAEGQMLDKMFGAIGLSRRDDIYASFCVPWSPPGGSAPTPFHLDICAPFVTKQIRLCAPKMIVLLGNTAARHVMQSRQTITQVRGKWTTLPDFGIEAIAICEPAMLLSQPQMKRTAWMDLLAIHAKLRDI